MCTELSLLATGWVRAEVLFFCSSSAASVGSIVGELAQERFDLDQLSERFSNREGSLAFRSLFATPERLLVSFFIILAYLLGKDVSLYSEVGKGSLCVGCLAEILFFGGLRPPADNAEGDRAGPSPEAKF